jgi:hypothetical protein
MVDSLNKGSAIMAIWMRTRHSFIKGGIRVQKIFSYRKRRTGLQERLRGFKPSAKWFQTGCQITTELVIESVNPCTPYNPVLYSQFVWPTLKFYSPWETDPVHEEEIFLYPASTVSGEEPGALNIFLSSKFGDKDMVGYCVFTYPVYDKATGLNNYHEDLPYIAFYSKLDIDPQAPPNPFTALSFDPVLSAAVKDMVENYSGGSLTGFSVDFVDII